VLDRNGAADARCETKADCPTNLVCIDGECTKVGRDAGPARDASVDAFVDPTDGGLDAGELPAHCRDGARTEDETDVDCGGACLPCGDCRACAVASDCLSGTCTRSVCRPVRTEVMLPGAVTPSSVEVREGRALLAHYAPMTWQSAYDPSLAQRTTRDGGEVAPADWAPDTCDESGHLAFGALAPSGHRVILECGENASSPDLSVASSLFTSFSDGTYGTAFADGVPGWGVVARLGSGQGRTGYEMCGGTLSAVRGGIAYCDGRGAATTFANHLVSFGTNSNSNGSWIGCGGRGCRTRAECDIHVWVWLEL
jgi:hypothetical protein